MIKRDLHNKKNNLIIRSDNKVRIHSSISYISPQGYYEKVINGEESKQVVKHYIIKKHYKVKSIRLKKSMSRRGNCCDNAT